MEEVLQAKAPGQRYALLLETKYTVADYYKWVEARVRDGEMTVLGWATAIALGTPLVASAVATVFPVLTLSLVLGGALVSLPAYGVIVAAVTGEGKVKKLEKFIRSGIDGHLKDVFKLEEKSDAQIKKLMETEKDAIMQDNKCVPCRKFYDIPSAAELTLSDRENIVRIVDPYSDLSNRFNKLNTRQGAMPRQVAGLKAGLSYFRQAWETGAGNEASGPRQLYMQQSYADTMKELESETQGWKTLGNDLGAFKQAHFALLGRISSREHVGRYSMGDATSLMKDTLEMEFYAGQRLIEAEKMQEELKQSMETLQKVMPASWETGTPPRVTYSP